MLTNEMRKAKHDHHWHKACIEIMFFDTTGICFGREHRSEWERFVDACCKCGEVRDDEQED